MFGKRSTHFDEYMEVDKHLFVEQHVQVFQGAMFFFIPMLSRSGRH